MYHFDVFITTPYQKYISVPKFGLTFPQQSLMLVGMDDQHFSRQVFAGADTYATFACVAYREQEEAFYEFGIQNEDDDAPGDDCGAGFVDWLPDLDMELPTCPACGGPSELREVLVPLDA